MFNALYVLYNVRPNFLMWRLWPPLGKNMASFACLVGLLVFNCTFSTNRIYHAIGVWNILCRAGDKTGTPINNEIILQTKKIINILWPGLCGDDSLAVISLLQRSLSSQSLGKYWQLNQNNQTTEHIRMQLCNYCLILTKKSSDVPQHREEAMVLYPVFLHVATVPHTLPVDMPPGHRHPGTHYRVCGGKSRSRNVAVACERLPDDAVVRFSAADLSSALLRKALCRGYFRVLATVSAPLPDVVRLRLWRYFSDRAYPLVCQLQSFHSHQTGA